MFRLASYSKGVCNEQLHCCDAKSKQLLSLLPIVFISSRLHLGSLDEPLNRLFIKRKLKTHLNVHIGSHHDYKFLETDLTILVRVNPVHHQHKLDPAQPGPNIIKTFVVLFK